LHDKANFAPHLNDIDLRDVNALDIDAAGVRFIELINHAQDCGFAASAGTDKRAEFTVINYQVQAAYCRMRAAGVGLIDVF
jgi:hypothetical protein